MAFIKNENLTFKNHKLKVILSGFPGVGKTTLALSSPKPLLIDFDKGIHRVKYNDRKDSTIYEFENFTSFWNDFTEENLKDFDTIIIDTAYKLQNMVIEDLRKTQPKAFQFDGTLSLKGYGILNSKMKEFLQRIYSLNKNVILIFHAKETIVKQGGDESTQLRLQASGAFKEEVWQDIDLGGLVESINGKRYITFESSEKSIGKGIQGVIGRYEIPNTEEEANVFLSSLFELAIKRLEANQKENNELNQTKEKLLSLEPNEAIKELKKIDKKQQKEVWLYLKQEFTKLGFVYDEENKTFSKDNTHTA